LRDLEGVSIQCQALVNSAWTKAIPKRANVTLREHQTPASHDASTAEDELDGPSSTDNSQLLVTREEFDGDDGELTDESLGAIVFTLPSVEEDIEELAAADANDSDSMAIRSTVWEADHFTGRAEDSDEELALLEFCGERGSREMCFDLEPLNGADSDEWGPDSMQWFKSSLMNELPACPADDDADGEAPDPAEASVIMDRQHASS
jgi:hypothetical protein